MFAVGWMELKDPRRAQDFLERSFANIAEPFKVGSGGSALVPSTPASTLAPGVGAGAQPQGRSPKGQSLAGSGWRPGGLAAWH